MKLKLLAAIAAVALTGFATSATAADTYVPTPAQITKSCLYRLPVTGPQHIVNLNQVVQMTIVREGDRYRLRIWLPMRYESDMPSVIAPTEEALVNIMNKIVQATALCHS